MLGYICAYQSWSDKSVQRLKYKQDSNIMCNGLQCTCFSLSIVLDVFYKIISITCND